MYAKTCLCVCVSVGRNSAANSGAVLHHCDRLIFVEGDLLSKWDQSGNWNSECLNASLRNKLNIKFERSVALSQKPGEI